MKMFTKVLIVLTKKGVLCCYFRQCYFIICVYESGKVFSVK